MQVDVCVYGGTAAGVVAAVTVARSGKSVVLIEPGRHVGGMTSGGLGYVDFGNSAAIGGISREFFRRVGKKYEGKKVVEAQGGKGRTDDGAVWIFEPSIAEQVLREMLDEAKVPVLMEHRLSAAQSGGGRLIRIELENVPAGRFNEPGETVIKHDTISAAMFIDCTYEGDLMAAAKVTFTVGREGVARYGESLNGVRAKTPSHQFDLPIDPYVKPGDPSSGLLPIVQSGDGGKPGDGDQCVQAYNFRLCFTNDPANRISLEEPAGYVVNRYELLARHVESLQKAGKLPGLHHALMKIDPVSPTKTDINNHGGMSTDFIGMNWEYPSAGYTQRARLWREHLQYIQGLLYFLATSPRVPEHIRTEMNTWGPCKDEFTDTAGWPHQMYVREARRLVSDVVVTQSVCEHKVSANDSVGLGAYNMDSHNCQRIVQGGVVKNEGDVQVAPSGPYPISYRAIIPRRGECENLLIPVCVSASHIAYGSIRMEPVFMVLGHSAGIAACQALADKTSVQDVNYDVLRQPLLDAGQVLSWPAKIPNTAR
jgi:FAD dependent oxidoreductase